MEDKDSIEPLFLQKLQLGGFLSKTLNKAIYITWGIGLVYLIYKIMGG